MQDTELPPNEPVLEGSGWGGLEAVRRHHSRSDWIDETGTPFPHALENPEVLENPGEEAPWLRLLGGEGFDGADSFVAGSDWEELLAADGSPEALFHLATMQHARQDFDAAIAGYREVLDAEGLAGSSVRTQALARRGLALALLAVAEEPAGKPADKLAGTPNAKSHARGEAPATTKALEELEAACRLEPESLPLLAEAMMVCIHWNNPHRALGLASQAPEGTIRVGRIRFLSALALADTGQAQAAAKILREGVEIPDLREGEDSIAELWQRVCPDEPVPARYRFSMW
jgi:tetratricopeptide (TPR) repeat protein